MGKAINKVILGDTTLMDISEDTVAEDNLLEGATAHAADGTQITGKVVVAEIVDSLEDQSTDKALSARQGYVLDQKFYKPEYTSFDKTKEPTEYSDIDLMTSGQVLPTILGKVTLMLKNIRYFFKLIGSTDISSIGDGTLTGALSTLNSNLTLLNKYEGGLLDGQDKEIYFSPGDYFEITVIGLSTRMCKIIGQFRSDGTPDYWVAKPSESIIQVSGNTNRISIGNPSGAGGVDIYSKKFKM